MINSCIPHITLPFAPTSSHFLRRTSVCGSRIIYTSLQTPLITFSNHCAKFNMGDKGKSGTNQRLCYLLSANVDFGTTWGSDKHMGKEQVRNICMPAGHTVAGKTLSHSQLLMKKRKLAKREM